MTHYHFYNFVPGKLDPEKGECIMFDIETTGLSRDSDIVQLSAFDGITEFNVYIRPNQPISKYATAISGITFSFEKKTLSIIMEEKWNQQI